MPTSRRIGLYSEAVDGSGTDRVPLAVLGRPSGLVFTTTYPGGDDTLTVNLELDTLAQPRALMVGRRIRACLAGSTIWQGRIDLATPGQPWQISCTGIGSMASEYQVNAASTTNSNVDAKIADGLPWIRSTSLPNGLSPASLQLITLSDALTAAATNAFQQWSVDRDGTLTFGALPATPSYLLLATDRPARTTANYITILYGLYVDSGTGLLAVVTGTGSAVHGIREDTVDLTAFGAITNTQAQNLVNTLVGRSGFRARYAAPFTVQPGRLLLYPGGTAKDPATVRAGIMVRPTGLDPDQLGETSVGVAASDVVIGATSYDDDTSVLTLTPYEDATHTNDLQQIVADLVKQAA